MAADKILTALINIALAASFALVLLISAPWSVAPTVTVAYYGSIGVFWLFLFLRLLLAQWKKNRDFTYKSYLGINNKIKKKLLMPSGEEIARMFGALLNPLYLLGLAALALAFILNHMILYFPASLTAHFSWLTNAQIFGRLSLERVLMALCLVGLIVLAGVVLAQTRAIKQNNKAYNIQNLIIHAHSQAALGSLQITLDTGDQMFLSLNKTEYILKAKAVPVLRHPSGQALLQIIISLRLDGSIPLTEFYVKRLSLFIADMVIECENDSQRFYPLFAVNNDFALDFYVLFKQTSAQKLVGKVLNAAGLRLYFCFILKNSVGVVTELYGTALYEKELVSGDCLRFSLQESKGNQYFYI